MITIKDLGITNYRDIEFIEAPTCGESNEQASLILEDDTGNYICSFLSQFDCDAKAGFSINQEGDVTIFVAPTLLTNEEPEPGKENTIVSIRANGDSKDLKQIGNFIDRFDIHHVVIIQEEIDNDGERVGRVISPTISIVK